IYRCSIPAASPPGARPTTIAAPTPSERARVTAGPLTIGDLRLIVADIPVSRPHHMSFTTLTAVNFVFVRIETRDGLVGWGEAACLGGPTWSEESAESIST